jgi:TPR repeat protein
MNDYERGRLAFERRRYSEAREMLAKAKDDGRAYLLLGQMASNGDGQPSDPALAASLYREGADRGNAVAAYNLGAMYANGRGVVADPAVALQWYQRSAELGDADASRMIGLMYASGQGGCQNFDKAESAWRAAAELGQRDAYADLGKLFAYHRKDPVEAADWYLKSVGAGNSAAIDELLRLCASLKALADGGNTRARTMLGVIFMLYVDAPAQTVELLTKSASEGDPVAQRTLAYLLERGQGVEVDRRRAVELYRSAAEAGDGTAAFNLGLHYVNGEVVKADMAEAVRWLRVAASAQVVESYAVLGNQLAALDLDEEALHWYVAGAEHGQANCMFAAGSWYRDGVGTSVNLVQGLRWFIAMLNVGRGEGVHEAHQMVSQMSEDDIRDAASLAGRPSDAEIFLEQRRAAGGDSESV